jgi:hypothetical protein
VAGVQQPPQVVLDGDVCLEVPGAPDDGVHLGPTGGGGGEGVGDPLAPAVVVGAGLGAADQQQLLSPAAGHQRPQARQEQPLGQVTGRAQDEQRLVGVTGHGSPVVWERAEVPVAPAVVGVGAVLWVVGARPVEVVDREAAVVWVVELAVEVDRVAVTDEVGRGRVAAGPEPPALPTLLALPAGGGRTSR